MNQKLAGGQDKGLARGLVRASKTRRPTEQADNPEVVAGRTRDQGQKAEVITTLVTASILAGRIVLAGGQWSENTADSVDFHHCFQCGWI